jgi:hypothetical protein
MVFVSRKIVYPFFLIIFSLVIFGIVFIAFLSNTLVVNNSSVSIVGDKIVLKMQIENTSNHEIGGINILVKSGIIDRGFFLKDSQGASTLKPNEKYDFVAAIPLGEGLNYSVEIKSLLNKSVFLNFELDQATIDPIKAEVKLPSKLIVGEEYTYSIKLCNQSNNDLGEIYWVPNAQPGEFKETFYEQVIDIKKSSCETLYSTLTPNRTGNIGLSFLLRIGTIEKRSSVVIEVVDKNS